MGGQRAGEQRGAVRARDGARLALTDGETDGDAVTTAVPVGVLVTTPVPDGDRLALGDKHTQAMSG